MFRNSIVPITAGVMLALAGSAQAAGTKTDHVRRHRQRGVELLHYDHACRLRQLRRHRGDRFERQRCRPLQQERPVHDRPERRHDGRLRSRQRLLAGPAATRWSTTCTRRRLGHRSGATAWARAGLRAPAAASDVANQVTHTVYGQSAQQRRQPGRRGRRLLATDHGHVSLLIDRRSCASSKSWQASSRRRQPCGCRRRRRDSFSISPLRLELSGQAATAALTVRNDEDAPALVQVETLHLVAGRRARTSSIRPRTCSCRRPCSRCRPGARSWCAWRCAAARTRPGNSATA